MSKTFGGAQMCMKRNDRYKEQRRKYPGGEFSANWNEHKTTKRNCSFLSLSYYLWSRSEASLEIPFHWRKCPTLLARREKKGCCCD